ncbi:alpha/beta fold hydrolase [Streptomyces sp. 8N616]|uniref:alpha/beta fold hydrolase n=1 Tax=Streptomyces sp. 8N616 TaxID=3457414 RepID=UPI003FD16990
MALLMVGTENDTPIELYYEDHGQGPPVVLIHGWPLSGRTWEYQTGPLVDAGHRVITYDRRGFGKSSQPWGGYDYPTFAADLHALIEYLDLRRATLVGFSMGGGEVARYISSYGTRRVAKAVFAAAVTPYLHKSAENPEGAMDDATIAAFEDGVRRDRIALVDLFTTTFFAAGDQHDLISEVQRAYYRDIAAAASPKGTLDCIGALARTDFRADLGKFDLPTLVIHGGSDALVPFEASGKRTHEAVANSRLVLIEGGPHGVNTTHPEQFNEALLDFLDS